MNRNEKRISLPIPVTNVAIPNQQLDERRSINKVRRNFNSTQTSNMSRSEECYSETWLQDIADLADSVLLNEEREKKSEDSMESGLSSNSNCTTLPQEPLNGAYGSDFAELDDPPITCNGEQIPVAAALLNHLDLFPPSRDNIKHCQEEFSKRSEYESEGNESEEEDGLLPPQGDSWRERFQELCHYKQQMGHCSVPHNFKENMRLARWVKRQRHQYRPYRNEEPEHLSESIKERMNSLDSIGFVWNCQEAAWEENFAELLDYHAIFLDCNVPSNYPQNPNLAIWVKGQRRQHKMYMEGKKSGMTAERVQKLESIGFLWEIRKRSKIKDFKNSPP